MKFVMITFALLFLSAKLQSQNLSYAPLNNNFSVTLQMNYVSSASIQLYAFSSSEIERNIFQETRGGYGYSAILKTNVISENVSLDQWHALTSPCSLEVAVLGIRRFGQRVSRCIDNSRSGRNQHN